MEAVAGDGGAVRAFVGGVPADATADELRERFARFLGPAVRLELALAPSKAPWRKDGEHRGAAFVTLVGAGALESREKLVKTFNRTKWRGCVLKVEPARPHYLDRLKAEWQEAEQKREEGKKKAIDAATAAAGASGREMKLAVAFKGKRTTEFMLDDEVEAYWEDRGDGYNEKERLDEEKEETEDDEGGSTSQEESEDEGQEESEESSDQDAGDQSQEEEGVNEEVIAEDDIEAFVRQMEAEATNDEGSDGEEVDDEAARAKANARRVAALEARQQLRQQKEEEQRKLVAAAVATGAKAKKITFDDDGEAHEQSEGEEEERNIGGDRLVTNWMDSDSEKDDNDEEEISTAAKAMDPEDRERLGLRQDAGQKKTLDFLGDDDDDEGAAEEQAEVDSEAAKAFALRPEFLGESGKKLFEMQKRFGGDQRFRLDARFMDDAENEFAGNDDPLEDGDMDDEIGDMQEFLAEDGRDDAAARERAWQGEQDTALAAIEKLFPDLDVEKIKHRLRVKAKKDPIKEASWMGRLMRYDPRDSNSRLEFELSMENSTSRGQKGRVENDPEVDEAARRKAERENKPVLVGGDRFFATSNNLGGLFTRVRKNSEDGMEGEAALDGVFGFGAAAVGESEATDGSNSGSAFKLSSLFDFPVEEKTIASMGESLLEKDDDHDAGNEPWHFTDAFRDQEDTRQADEDMETDGEEEEDAEEDEANVKKSKAKNKRSLADFLAFGRTFMRNAEGDDKDWAERRKKLTLDFKRKRRDTLKSKKKQQQQFAKQKKQRRA